MNDALAARGPLRSTSRYEAPPGLHWDDETYQGDAYGAYAWAVYVAEVSVDTTTFETRVDDFVALQEVGKVIHPVLAAGQITFDMENNEYQVWLNKLSSAAVSVGPAF